MGNNKLISIHIPKTAGTSFRYTLIDVYGIERVLPFYYTEESNISYKIPKRIQVIHGHISIGQYNELIRHNPEWRDATVITWIRDPVDRFISNYYYMKGVLYQQLGKFNDDTPNLKNRMICSLDEFLERPNEWNETVKFVSEDDINSGKFSFIGNVNSYDADLKLLAQMLKWESYATYKHNVTQKKKSIDEDKRALIKNNLKGDMFIYNKMMQWRDENIPSLKKHFEPKITSRDRLKLRNRIIGKILPALAKFNS
ncbi:sulfotransferase family 2 domain-containing protein [Ekhidna sp. MALMAid0563]|uniref:sulfotransferase family 2 domain-containing protein n=1 Tax=Ekhidna sp. MALMAid0563 TaxID=3143937 RepID=UPI0032DEFF49